MRKNSDGRVVRIAGLALVLLVASSPLAVAGGCFSASVASPMILPGGDEIASGTLTLCVTRDLSPVSALHKTYVDGNPVAMLVSRRGFSEGSRDGRPFMMFNRDSRGRLHLYGFATPADGRMVTYRVGTDAKWLNAARLQNRQSEAQPVQPETFSTVRVSALGPSNGRQR